MLYRVTGIDRSGQSFASRFEAHSEAHLRQWMADNGIAVTTISALPLTKGPYAKLPWLILAFPVLAAVLVYTCVHLVKSTAAGQTDWTAFLITLLLDAGLAIIIYNILLRLGSHYELDDGRILQYAKGERVVTSADDEDSSEND